MSLELIVTLVSLASNLGLIVYSLGAAKNTYVPRSEFAAFEKATTAELARKERDSLSQHNNFATRLDVEKMESRLTEEVRSIRGNVASLANQFAAFRQVKSNDSSIPK